ncbi:MAG: response regulator [Chitinivibrionales bacterium]|nr:response regulator [Chitinivibrionales bacterium]
MGNSLLIVDDEKSICDILSQYLQHEGYSVAVARCAEEAMSIIEQNELDMVLSDIKMPGMSGVDLLKWIKEKNRNLPVLLTTGFPTLDTAIEALKLGAFDYLTKPFHLEEIGEKIKRALASRQLEEENLLFSKLVSLHEVTKIFSATHNLTELYEKILNYCSKLSKADGGSLMFFNHQAQLGLVKVYGEEFPDAYWEHPIFQTMGTTVSKEGEPRIVSRNAPNGNDHPESMQSYIAFPLKTYQRVLGVLNLVRRAPGTDFSGLDLEIINVLASQATIAIENVRLYQNIRDNYLKTIRAFALAVEAKDRYTHGHSENVMNYTVKLASQMGLNDSEIEKIKYAGLLHDIGKIGVSELILNKPGKLTGAEFEEIKRHPELGARIIADVPFLKSLVPLILHHHEFYNGLGYPEGIAGDDIPYGARILAVCDSFEAMTSDRPYRTALSREKAYSILMENKGIQFDPNIVEVFADMISQGIVKPA